MKLREEFHADKLNIVRELEEKRINTEVMLKEQIERLQVEKRILKCTNDALTSERRDLVPSLPASSVDAEIKSVHNQQAIDNSKSSGTEFLKKMDNIMRKPSKKSLHKVKLMVSRI